MPLILQGATSGQTTIQATDATTQTITLPANSGTVLTSLSTQSQLPANIAGNGPAFSAYQTSGQTLSSSTYTKLLFDTKDFDTNSNYSTSTSRFTPTVAGYYFANASIGAGNNSQNIAFIYKNGSSVRSGTNVSNGYVGIVTTLVYCNGTTDYLEAYGYMALGAATGTGLGGTMFQAFLARSA